MSLVHLEPLRKEALREMNKDPESFPEEIIEFIQNVNLSEITPEIDDDLKTR